MSIDVKEWARKYLAQYDRHVNDGAMDRFAAAVEFHVDLINAVIAEREPAQTEPAAEAGVPEWCVDVAWNWIDRRLSGKIGGVGLSRDGGHCESLSKEIHKAAEAEIARRVAEAGAERDAWKDTAAQHLRNEEFYRGIVSEIGEQFGIEAKTSDDGSVQDSVLALKVPELVAALKQQLAAAQAEVERLTRVLREQDEYRLASEKELARLRDENARLTRPVEDERSFFASDANNDVSEVVGVLRHRAERNAREAAEAERDEVESIVNRFCEDVLAWSKAGQKDDGLPFPLRVRGSSAGEEWTMHNLPLVLASPVACLKERYRAEKGKVQQ